MCKSQLFRKKEYGFVILGHCHRCGVWALSVPENIEDDIWYPANDPDAQELWHPILLIIAFILGAFVALGLVVIFLS